MKLEMYGHYYRMFKGTGGVPTKVTVVGIEGDTVTLIGQDGDNYLSVNQISLLSNTITNETLSVIGQRVKRVYHL